MLKEYSMKMTYNGILIYWKFCDLVLPDRFTCKSSLWWVIFLVWGLWFLLHSNTESSLGLLLDILLFPCVMEILKLWMFKSLHLVQKFIDGVDVRVGKFRVLDLGLGRHWVGHTSSSLLPMPLGAPLLLCPVEVQCQLYWFHTLKASSSSCHR